MSKRIFSVFASVLLLFGCGGSSSSSSPPPPVTNMHVGGIWEGTVTVAGFGTLELLGLVAEDGRAHFIQEDGTQYWGTVTASGNQISANITGAVPVGYVFQDGSTSGTGTITGTIAERSTITASSTFTTTLGTVTNGTISMVFNPLYNRDSSLATVAGNYTNFFAPGSDAMNVSGTGVLFGQDPGTGCVINGTVGIIDPAYNAYQLQYSYASCTGGSSILNGSSFSGIATLDNTIAPEQAIAGVQGTVGAVLYSIIFWYERT